MLNLRGDKGGKSIIKSSHKIKYVNVSENTLFEIDNIDGFNNLLRIEGPLLIGEIDRKNII